MHSKKILLSTLFTFLSATALYSQVLIYSPIASPGRLRTDKLFNGNIDNQGSLTQEGVWMECAVTDQNGTLLLHWRSSLLTLDPGMHSFSSLGIQSRTIQYIQGSDILQRHPFLPIGEYSISYELKKNVSGLEEVIAFAGGMLYSEEFPAILLLNVEDKDTLTNKFPAFNWSALVPPEQAQDGSGKWELEYRITIKEVYSGQSLLEAMLYNPVHHEEKGIRGTSFQYPFAGRPFADSAVYVWQVNAVSQSENIASSEVWCFIYHPKPKPVKNSPVVILNPERSAAGVKVQNNVLKVGYHEKRGGDAPMPIRAEIYDSGRNLVRSSEDIGYKAYQGFNAFNSSLCPDGLDLPDGSYILRLYTLNGEKMELNFIYIRTNECE